MSLATSDLCVIPGGVGAVRARAWPSSVVSWLSRLMTYVMWSLLGGVCPSCFDTASAGGT